MSLHTQGLAPEFAEFFARFADREVLERAQLDKETTDIVTLASLLGCGGIDEFRLRLPDVGPTLAREVTYQATAYLGIGRTRVFHQALVDAYGADEEERGTVTPETRRAAGTAKQVAYFGEQMAEAWQASDINYLLAANCFGDYYTRRSFRCRPRARHLLLPRRPRRGGRARYRARWCEHEPGGHARIP